jgi:hypothetical protein
MNRKGRIEVERRCHQLARKERKERIPVIALL